jgi:signal transduction histidine kinase
MNGLIQKLFRKGVDNKQSIWLFIVFFVILFLSILYLSVRYNNEINDLHSAKRLQSILLEIQQELDEVYLTIHIQDGKKICSTDELNDIKRKLGCELFLFKNDSLKYWTTNLILVESFKKNICNSKFLKLNNGWYASSFIKFDNNLLVGLIPVKSEYKYENELLPESFNELFQIGDYYKIQLEHGEHNILNKEGDFLFSINRINDQKVSNNQAYILFFLYHLLLVLLLVILKRLHEYIFKLLNAKSFIPIFYLANILVIWIVISYLKIPKLLYTSFLFSPNTFADAGHHSIGNYFTNVIFILYIVYVIIIKEKILNNIFKNWPIIKLVILLGLLFPGFILYEKSITSLFRNSQFTYQFGQEFISSPGISILIFSILSAISLALFLFSQYAVKEIDKTFLKLTNQLIFWIGFIFIYGIFCYLKSDFFVYSIIFVVILLLALKFIRTDRYSAIQVVLYLILFSVYMSLLSTFVLQEKELSERQILAEQIVGMRDPQAEFDFLKIERKIYKDSLLISKVRNTTTDKYEEEIIERIKVYFSETSWRKYTPYITICDSLTVLDIQPDNYKINGNEYFQSFVDADGNSCKNKNLIHVNNDNLNNSYIARLKFDSDRDNYNDINIYIELVSEFIPDGVGYTELFTDKSYEVKGKDIINYSFARYEKDELTYKFGAFLYSFNFNQFSKFEGNKSLFNCDKFNHLVYKFEDDKILVISRPQNGFWERITPFSYFFILLSLFLLCFFLVINLSLKIFNTSISFKQRVQFALTSVIFFSFLVIGTITMFYILDLNEKKNREILSEKAHSVLVELEHKLSNEKELSLKKTDYYNSLLSKFSLVFFSDINLFDLEGRKIASSRNRIFDEGLISPLMHPEAYKVLTESEELLFIQNEAIGNYKYLSAYIPFRNSNNQIIAYLNLPYFARQSEIQKEISTFLVALVNIYLLFFVIGIILTLLISRNISKPLEIIRSGMGQLKLGKLNKKISWNKKDEIGSLIFEYNRMIDELSESANLLAKSERESAWREMAKQVAHEIKNPLTPMKLSVQFLKKSWDEKNPDWGERLKHFSTTIIDQIDTLSEIASAFSDFAKMPKQKVEPIELNDKIKKLVGLFKEHENIKIQFESEIEKCFIIADKNQILRVFNNLIKNSIQAIGRNENGLVIIKLNRQNEKIIISVNDNGMGIPIERSDKVFSPSFTTKTGGMGLGLSIVKSIVIETGGKIWFESEINKGTSFYVEFPIYKN